MKPTLASLFPNASQSCQNVNPELVVKLATTQAKNAVARRIGTENGKRGEMNKTEAQFGLMLEAQKRNGEIRDYLFQPFSLPWGLDPETGKPMRYTPDWMVTPNSGIEKRRLIEIKGPHIHYSQQAIARFKGARAYWPEFQFEMWQLKKGQGWKRKF